MNLYLEDKVRTFENCLNRKFFFIFITQLTPCIDTSFSESCAPIDLRNWTNLCFQQMQK